MIVFMYLFVQNCTYGFAKSNCVLKCILWVCSTIRVTWVANQAANQNTIFCISVTTCDK